MPLSLTIMDGIFSFLYERCVADEPKTIALILLVFRARELFIAQIATFIAELDSLQYLAVINEQGLEDIFAGHLHIAT